ncbi:MAG TPA: rhodanese-like domain-containing protein [Candidatus Paceibacterota bacterium]|nr:rhodanese-like domain-containing protein [Candidatus Paceibacterota bacterium]
MLGSRPHSISVLEAHERSAQGSGVLIDVRTPAEFSGARPMGARNIPLDELERSVDDLRSHEEIYVICRSGGRSAAAAMLLAALGFGNVVNVSGGLLAWAAAGLPTEP